jgi:LDH2 family malate/lactate/ureidoglycolate dehydrogenase
MAERYKVSELRNLATAILRAAGLKDEPARAVAAGLVEADLYGHSTHGLALLADYVAEIDRGVMQTTGRPTIVSDQGAVACWDAGRLPGIWTTALAVEAAAGKAKAFGIGAVAVRRSHHIGCLAAFLEEPARNGFVVIIMCSDPSDGHVAPFGGITPVLTPNPIAAGIPGQRAPILIDISTSITTAAMCGRAKAAGQRLPGAWMLDAAGRISDDPAILETGGSILPIGGVDHGHKGFALSLLIEALTQGLSGHGRVDAPKDWGASVLVLAFAPSAFSSREVFCRQVEGIADACKAAAPIPDGGGVRLPGEQALAKKKAAERRGVELDPRTATQLTELAARFGMAMAGGHSVNPP